ncbi:tRNA (adenosine(37)-N6)-threonylcarbamoyltransferase complex ATPase subunit type 1 TsaE [uncultured Roseobacter sp.]|uniref:tRNA (adenosine(37)-N6)-threonylcarbamoyltransferase complex ATPase subunit type 1 TsaE n=1 Tax=uncultured Roseobacter sp. TaxID=114847 RepID=UPI002612A30D|nr:tRNA (adenosine(37)-N6)-threonylcarbamoyltransferase complex ATPase subunit type 1 TsaE [uncultured Roseobacter sp.]
MILSPYIQQLTTSEATAEVAAHLAPTLKAGDVLLLNGAVGAGKTFFARHLIQSVLIEKEDVPSPTFTLVQTYETVIGPIWHTDLYRIQSLGEIEELGLIEAFEEAVCLVEWPDRLGPLRPEAALELWFSEGQNENERVLKTAWQDSLWDARMQQWKS